MQFRLLTPTVLTPTVLTLAALAIAGGELAAQVVVGNPGVRTPRAERWYRGGPSYGGYYDGWGYGSTTPIEGARRGMADVISARGQAAEDYSRALINTEEAKSAYLDNKKKMTEVYWERRRLTESEKQIDYDKERDRRDAWRANQTRDVARLNPSQLDPTTGKVYWPTPLEGPAFYDDRKKLEELMMQRAQTSSYPGLSSEINRTVLAMKEELKSHIKEMTPPDYIASRKFLDSLNNEVLAPNT